jgi:hypothetical protein
MNYRGILGGALVVILILCAVAIVQDERITRLEADLQSLRFQTGGQPVIFSAEEKVALHRCVTDSECEGLTEF